MLLILLLLSDVSGEWVEISQNNYRPHTIRKTDLVGQENIYANSTIPPVQWTKAVVDKLSNMGNVEKVATTNVKIPPKTRLDKEVTIRKEEKVTKSSVTTRNEVFQIKKHRISDKWINEGKDHTSIFSEENKKWVHVSTKAPTAGSDTSSREEKVVIGHSDSNSLDKFVQNNFESDQSTFEFIAKEFINDTQLKLPQSFLLFHEPKNATKSNIIDQDKNAILNDMTNGSHITKSNKTETDDATTKFEQESSEYVSVEESHEPVSTEGDKIKVFNSSSTSNSVDKMWKLIKTITDTISRNTRSGFKSKVHYLEDLRNMILANIEERIDLAWPDDPNPRQSRSTREADDRGHVEFPSSEGALMTISFLTFAVFLVKLVLQVIHTYKSKTMMVTPAVVTAVGRAVYALHKNKHT